MLQIKKIISILKTLINQYGWRFLFVIFCRFVEFIYYCLCVHKYFTFQGRQYKYHRSLYNAAYKKERAVEIPIIQVYLQEEKGKEILEVGNVLSFYMKAEHDVVDKYEIEGKVINEDIISYAPNKKYDLIISISTLEHVGWDEEPREKGKVCRAIANMKRMLKQGGKIVATIPLGYNDEIDALLKNGEMGTSEIYYLKRMTNDNQWKEVQASQIEYKKCNQPYLFSYEIAVIVFF